MTRKILNAIIFLCVPVAILITTVVHRDPTYEGKPAAVWVKEIRTDPDAAMNALQHMGKRALPALRDMLTTASVTERCRAARAMGRLDPVVARAAIPDLKQALGDGPAVRSEAILALMHIGVTDADLAPRLIGELTNDWTGAVAATLLNSIETNRAAMGLPPLPEAGYTYGMACLKSPSPGVRINGAYQLASVAQKDPRAKAALESLLHDYHPWVRNEAARVMANPTAPMDFRMVAESEWK